MSRVYDFTSYRLVRVLKGIYEEKERIVSKLAERNNHLRTIEENLVSFSQALKTFDAKLHKHQLACQQTQEQNNQIMNVLETDDLEELLVVRKRITKSNGN